MSVRIREISNEIFSDIELIDVLLSQKKNKVVHTE